MIVCVCRRVSDRDIHRTVREGVGSFDELQDETAVATGCGACLDCAREIFAEACCNPQATAAAAAPRTAAPARGAAAAARPGTAPAARTGAAPATAWRSMTFRPPAATAGAR